MASKPALSSLFFFFFLVYSLAASASCRGAGGGGRGGQWQVLQKSIGISAMHMQLLHNDRVVVFDRTDSGPSNLSLPGDKCRGGLDAKKPTDCTAHSAEYDVVDNSFRPLSIHTDTWCSSGAVSADGALIQTGGFNSGDRVVRTFQPCDNASCDWVESSVDTLAARRWYASNHILPDGRIVVVGGRRQFNYEFVDPNSIGANAATFALPFLRETMDAAEDNLYPFVHLNIDGNLFIFANNRAILLDYTKNAVVRTYPAIPGGGHPRNYPSTGSSVLLPLQPSPTVAEVLICGGAPAGSYTRAYKNKTFIPALDTCARLEITDPEAKWSLERMPLARVMGDMVLLPTGEVLIINGAASGTAGWELGTDPVRTPVVYWPEASAGARFSVDAAAATPRMYHSTAVLLRDCRVLVGGSNAHAKYRFAGVEFPTDLSLEAFSPAYLAAEKAALRPSVAVTPTTPIELRYGAKLELNYTLKNQSEEGMKVTMVAPAFATHSFSMNQRLLFLETGLAVDNGGGAYCVTAVAPSSRNLAPAGYYMVFVLNGGIPSEGVWVYMH